VVNWAKAPGNAKTCQSYIFKFRLAISARASEGRWPYGLPFSQKELWGTSKLKRSSGTTGVSQGNGDDQSEDVDDFDTTSLMAVFIAIDHILDHIGGSADIPMSTSSTSVVNNTDSFDAGGEPFWKTVSDPTLRPVLQRIEEIVATERKYVRQLEVLQRYSLETVKAQLLSMETVHNMFCNLPKILDFQRKFLIKLETEYQHVLEGGAAAWTKGRWGRPFIEMEADFACYGPYCAKFEEAGKLIMEYSGVLAKGQELPLDQRPCLDATGLGTYRITPIQRIMKYFLLLQELNKVIEPHDYAFKDELVASIAAAKRIADVNNEATAFAQRQAKVRELVERVDDWKGHDHDKFGELYLDAEFAVSKSDSPRDYHVFLFEKMMLCCKEVHDKKKPGSRKGQPPVKNPSAKPRLQLKGRIFVSNISSAVLLPDQPGVGPRVEITWSVPDKINGDDVEDSFVISGPVEKLKEWCVKIIELAENARDEALQTARYPSSSHWAHTPVSSYSNFFSPQTPSAPYHSLPSSSYDLSEDVPLNGLGIMYPHGSNRRVQSQQSMPPAYPPEMRARAMTEDHNGPSIAQWRHQQAPPLPQAPSLARIPSQGEQQPWNASLGRRAVGRMQPLDDDDEMERTMSQGPSSYRYESRVMGPRAPSSAPMSMRSRSASSPNVHQDAHVLPPQAAMPQTAGLNSPWPEQNASSSSINGGTAYFNRRMSTGKRSSAESQTTETSETSSQSPRTPYTAATPVSRQNSQEGAATAPAKLFVKVRSGDANFVIPLGHDISYITLYETVLKKLRSRSLRHSTEDVPIKIKWLDSDGDEVVINTDSDVHVMISEATSEQIQLVAV
jgi:cell division control protein 24